MLNQPLTQRMDGFLSELRTKKSKRNFVCRNNESAVIQRESTPDGGFPS